MALAKASRLHSCVLIRRPTPLLAEEQQKAFEKIVRRALSQRRKMMVKLLKTDWPVDKLQSGLVTLQLRPDVRGEKLSLEQFVALTRILVRDE